MNAYTDGACRVSNPGLCSCAWAVYTDGAHFASHGRVLEGIHTNNEAEYQGLLDLLRWARGKEVQSLNIYSDSQLIVNQVNGVWMARAHLEDMCAEARKHLAWGCHKLQWVRGHEGSEGNIFVDRLCNEVLDTWQREEKNYASTTLQTPAA